MVHLGVLANYAQRADQTSSGLQAVQRFLNTVLLFPAFNPRAVSAHFDSKIAEHVAHVIDTIIQMNLTQLSGGANKSRQHPQFSGNLLNNQVAHLAKINSSGNENLRLQLQNYVRMFVF